MSAYLLANTGKADIFIIEYIQSPCTGSVPSCTWTFCAKKMIYPPDVHVSGYTKSRKEEIWQTVKIKASGFWRFDMSKEALCMKTVRTKKKSWPSCSKYECKIPY